MRKITIEIAQAFRNHKSMTRSGTGATSTDGEAIYLHDNKIVERRGGDIFITLAGWNTLTTRERLKPFANVRFTKGKLTMNGKSWDGKWALAD